MSQCVAKKFDGLRSSAKMNDGDACLASAPIAGMQLMVPEWWKTQNGLGMLRKTIRSIELEVWILVF
jgi:hypothetical protein